MTFKRRYIIVLTVNSLISILFMSTIPFFLFRHFTPKEYKNTGLISQPNFHKELYARLTDNDDILKEIPRGPHILMILTKERGVVYNKEAHGIMDLDVNTALLGMHKFYNVKSRYRTESFTYGDDYGIFVFKVDRRSIIGAVRLYIIPISIFCVLCFILLPSIINFTMLYNLKRSFSKLEDSADRISRGDFDLNLVRKKRDELYSFYKSFNRMGKMLKDNRDQKARLLMSISHDLKTPLTSMKGYIEAFKDNLVPAKSVDRYINIIGDKTALLEERINSLVDFSKMDTIEWKKTFTKIKLYPFLIDIATAFKDDCIIYKRDFSYNISLKPYWNINGDPKLLMRALENILENAKRYTSEEGKINLDIFCEMNILFISIKDNGEGIEKEDLEYIFEPFYKVDKGRNSKGMGMGLYNVKSIIDNHGGSIKCDSIKGEGSTFTIMFDNIYTLDN